MPVERPDPIGIRCFPVRMDDGTIRVLGRGSRSSAGRRTDGDYVGDAPIIVQRDALGDVVRMKPVEEAGAHVRQPMPVFGKYIESIYNVSTVQFLFNNPVVEGDYITTDPFDLAAYVDSGTGTLVPDPVPGTDWYIAETPSAAPYCLVSSLSNPVTLYATYPFDGINGPYDYEYVVYDLRGLLYLFDP